MRFLIVAAWMILIGISISACFTIPPPPDNAPPYGQANGQKRPASK